jgi:Concanavalin A-like lectin/glucanases superfamily/Lamin Tail Domain/CotH kinase protein
MRRLLLLILALVASWSCTAFADSAVVFNEVMYHPATNEAAMEWVELHNLMSVDMDISGWTLAGGIDYQFPEGTIVAGGGYLVIASSPSILMAASSATNVLGPFSGRLSNSGETLELRNNNNRIVDSLAYGVEGDWPVAPDGSGVSLAKRIPNGATQEPKNWTWGEQIGGTPGAENFPAAVPNIAQNSVISIQGDWKFNDAGIDLGTAWYNPTFDDAPWPEGASLFYRGSASLPATKNTQLAAGRTTYYFRDRFVFSGNPAMTQLRIQPLIDDGAVFYLNGVEISRFNMPAGAINYSTLANSAVGTATYGNPILIPGTALNVGTNVLAVEVHQAHSVVAYPSAVLTSSPVGYWRLGESGGVVIDSASAAGSPQAGAQNGTYLGIQSTNLAQAGPQLADSVAGQSLAGFEFNNAAPKFSGNNDGGDDVVLISDPGALNFSSNRAFTLEAWVNGPATQEAGACIITKGFGGGGEQYSLDVQGNGFRFYVRDANTTSTGITASSGPDGTWQHVVATYDQLNGIMRLYVNGVLAVSGTPRATLLNTTDPVSIGSRKANSSSGYTLNFDGRIDEVAIYNRALSSAEVLTHFNAAFDNSAGSPVDTNDVVFGMQMDSLETLPPPSLPKLVFNEVASATNTFFIEVINKDSTNANIAGCSITRMRNGTNSDYILPSQVLAPGSLLQFTKKIMGFGADPGDKFFLYGPGRTNMLDAVVAEDALRGRYPDGTGAWLYPNQPTPGFSNYFAFHNEIVINEIMYHHLNSLGQPESPEAWVELYNRSTNAVNLTGWSLDGDIQFSFPAGKIIAAGGYLVVAADASYVASLYPGIDVIGPFSGKLSKSSGHLVLRDDNNNPANQVDYHDGGRWPEYADGGGSSLELRDPHADNSKAEAWAASNEGTNSGWQTYTYRAVAQTALPNSPSSWNEFLLGLINGPGEALIDDISVIESPDTVPVQFIQNGSFNGGDASHWRFLGTHRLSRVEPEPGNPGNYVLHLIATGPTEYQGNQIETTFNSGRSVVDGRTYQISFRAKWIAGGNLLNSRLYFDRLARTSVLTVPTKNGTPGRQNSVYVSNIGPVYDDLHHDPAVPNAGQSVNVSVTAQDPDGVNSLKLWYAPEGANWSFVVMTNVAGNNFQATLPGQSAGTLVQFYVEGRDALGAVSFFPAAGTNSRALYRVNDGQAVSGLVHNFRLLMTAADANFMHTDTNVLSNAYLKGTVVYDEREVFYNVGVRLKGSFVGRNVPRVGFSIAFGADQKFQGIYEDVAIDRSQGAVIGQGEIIAKHIASHAGGIPNMYDDLVRFIAPRAQDNSMAQLRTAAFGDIYLDTQFDHGSDNPMYECEVLRYSSTTSDGTTEGIKLPGQGFVNVDLGNYGNDPESYRWLLLQSNNRGANDYQRIVPMAQAFSLTGAAIDLQSQSLMDVDEWLRVFAYQELLGVSDTYFSGGSCHNFRMYVRPGDQKVIAMPWDWDSSFNKSATAGLVGNGNLAKIVNLPNNLRAYYGHFYDLINTTFNTRYMTRWTQHYGALANQDFSGILNYIGQRANYVMSQLPTTTPFAITSNAGNNYDTNQNHVMITGTAPIQVKTIQVNGITYALNWTTPSTWNLTLPLNAGTNVLVVQGVDAHGVALSNAVDTVTIVNTGTGAPLPVVINEWMADNASPNGFPDPADGLFKDWFELYNPNAFAIDLTGYFLTDDLTMPTLWRIPTNSIVPGQGFQLVWADNLTNLNSFTVGSDIHAPFQLSKSGESIGLFSPNGVTPQSVVQFGPQLQNISEGLFPDGNTNSVHAMSNFSPRHANLLRSFAFTDFSVSQEGVVLGWESIPGETYRLQYKTNLMQQNWVDVVPDISAGGSYLRATNQNSIDAQRFYRVLRVN